MGISSSRFLPTSKPANDAADGRQINVLMAAMLQMPSVLECARPGRCMSPGHAAPARDLGPIMLAAERWRVRSWRALRYADYRERRPDMRRADKKSRHGSRLDARAAGGVPRQPTGRATVPVAACASLGLPVFVLLISIKYCDEKTHDLCSIHLGL